MSELISQPEEDWSVGQEVEITAGPWAGFQGVIDFIDREKRIVSVKVNFWGKETPVQLNFSQIKSSG